MTCLRFVYIDTLTHTAQRTERMLSVCSVRCLLNSFFISVAFDSSLSRYVVSCMRMCCIRAYRIHTFSRFFLVARQPTSDMTKIFFIFIFVVSFTFTFSNATTYDGTRRRVAYRIINREFSEPTGIVVHRIRWMLMGTEAETTAGNGRRTTSTASAGNARFKKKTHSANRDHIWIVNRIVVTSPVARARALDGNDRRAKWIFFSALFYYNKLFAFIFSACLSTFAHIDFGWRLEWVLPLKLF